MSVSIRQINGADAELLSALARSIYREYYLHLWHPGGADWYQHTYAYPADKLRNELDNPDNLHYVVYENDVPAGYLKLCINANRENIEYQDCLEIERIYLHRFAAGKGTGKQLMLLSEAIAKKHHKPYIILKAMDSSEEALGFYQLMGYRICGSLVLPFEQMKKEYRGMLVLKKKI